MQTQGLLLIAAAVPNILIGLFILVRNARDKVNIFFSILAFAASSWSLGLAAYIFTDDLNIAYHLAQFFYLAAAIIAVAFAYFSIFYTNAKRRFSMMHMGMAVPLVLLACLLIIQPDFLMSEVVRRSWGKEVLLNNTGYLLYGIFFVCYVAYGFRTVLRHYLVSKGARRINLKFVTGGFFIAFLLGATFNLILPFFSNYQYIWVGPLFTIFYIGLISYAIVKHGLFDIRAKIARLFAYLFAVFSLSLGFGVGVAVVIDRLQLQGIYLQVAVGVAIVLVTLVYPATKRFFDTVTEKLFFQKQYNTQQAIDTITGLMVTVRTLDELLASVAKSLQNFVGAESITVSLTQTAVAQHTAYTTREGEMDVPAPILAEASMLSKDKRVLIADEVDDEAVQSELAQASVAAIGQLRSQTGLVGYVLFGYKRGGGSYTKRDVDFIDIVSDEFALAIENLLRFEEIAQFNVELKHKIDEATAELRIANEKLHEIDKSKDEFISMASHQLRTPLTAVKGYISMILEGDIGKITPEQRGVLEQAYNSSQRMVFLIGDFLNVSRLQTGKFVLERSSINFTKLVEEEVDQLRDTARARKITLKYEKPHTDYIGVADENKLRQVMMNFMDNAIFYSPAGSTVNVQLYKEPGGLVFRINDQGIGVPKSEQAKLFTKFFRAGNARQQRPDGTGIGLYMAKKVILAHGGTIIFESKEGVGSTFGFRVPLENNLKKLNQQPDAAASDR